MNFYYYNNNFFLPIKLIAKEEHTYYIPIELKKEFLEKPNEFLSSLLNQ